MTGIGHFMAGAVDQGGLPAKHRPMNTVSRQVERALLLLIGYIDAMEIALLILAIGVVGPIYLLAKRVGPVVPFAFIAAYVLAVGAITFIGIAVFDVIDVKFRQAPLSAWLEVSWPAATILYVPNVISALVACWLSRSSTRRDAATLLGVYLFLILVAIWAARAISSAVGFWFLLALPSTIFFVMALVKRVGHGQHQVSRTT